MERSGKQAALYLASAGLMTCFVVSTAAAAPPTIANDGAALRSSVTSVHLAPTASLANAPRRLDLRLPALAAANDKPAIFMHGFSRRELASAQDDAEVPTSFMERSGATNRTSAETGGNERTPTRVEALAQQFRREGLPVARLWENDSALLHLGLNQKGKPGLWIVQKLH